MNGFQNTFHRGQIIHHKMFNYRGVVVGVDQEFDLSEAWYEEVARSRPPRDRPWYHVLVDGSHQTTYVAERNLEPSTSDDPVENPMLDRFFDEFSEGFYSNSREQN